MDTKQIIEAIGGRKKVIALTGLTRGRISQWVTGNNIPTPWLKFFRAKFPRLDWEQMLSTSGDSSEKVTLSVQSVSTD